MHQSRLASMGEMIDAIAHQWQQPIQLLKLRVGLLSNAFESNELSKEYMKKFEEKITININHMTTTLNEFRTFFRPNKETKNFYMKNSVETVLVVIEDEVTKNNIIVNINTINNFYITGVENEFKHLILNLLNNAKNAFLEKKIPFTNRKIDILIDENKYIKKFEIIDNAGGIDSNLIQNIFNANVTTRVKSNGTGIGLYLSSQIAQKYNGILKVENINDGAKFTYEEHKTIG